MGIERTRRVGTVEYMDLASVVMLCVAGLAWAVKKFRPFVAAIVLGAGLISLFNGWNAFVAGDLPGFLGAFLLVGLGAWCGRWVVREARALRREEVHLVAQGFTTVLFSGGGIVGYELAPRAGGGEAGLLRLGSGTRTMTIVTSEGCETRVKNVEEFSAGLLCPPGEEGDEVKFLLDRWRDGGTLVDVELEFSTIDGVLRYTKLVVAGEGMSIAMGFA